MIDNPLVDYLAPIILSIELATITTLILIIITLPLAWWLVHCRHGTKSIVAAIATLPIILPPSVLGFYLLLLLGQQGPLGQLSQHLGLGALVFSFQGLVIASVIYSFPFALQPVLNAFENVDKKLLETAATLGASPFDRFKSIALPLSKNGILTSIVLSFAHTIVFSFIVLLCVYLLNHANNKQHTHKAVTL